MTAAAVRQKRLWKRIGNLPRQLLERAVRGRTVWRRLSNGIEVALSPDSQLKYLGFTIDPDLDNLARQHVREGSVVWDIGANCGTFIFSCHHAANRIAVEPDPFLAGLIKRSSERNGLPVRCYQAAVGERSGQADLVIAKRGRAANHLIAVKGSTQTGGDRDTVTVPMMTLDDLLDKEGRPDFVKIDVEGAELLVLGGATRLLEQQPTIYIEVFREQADACRAILAHANYTIEEGTNWLATPRAQRS